MLLMCAVCLSVRPSVTNASNDPAAQRSGLETRLHCAGSFGATFVKPLWPLVLLTVYSNPITFAFRFALGTKRLQCNVTLSNQAEAATTNTRCKTSTFQIRRQLIIILSGFLSV